MYTNEDPGMRGVLYNVQANFHCNTPFCYANRDACREAWGFLHDVRYPSFSELNRKRCWTLTDLVLIHVSNVVHFNPFFCDLIRRDNRCCLDLSFGYFFIRKDKGDRFIKNLFFSDFENCDWNLSGKVSVLCSCFKSYYKIFIHICFVIFYLKCGSYTW